MTDAQPRASVGSRCARDLSSPRSVAQVTVAYMFTRRPKQWAIVSDPPPLQPEPAEDDLVEVLSDAQQVAETLAHEPASAAKDIGMQVSYILRALHDAVQVIVYRKIIQAEEGPLQDARVEEDTLRQLQDAKLEAEENKNAQNPEANEKLAEHIRKMAAADRRVRQARELEAAEKFIRELADLTLTFKRNTQRNLAPFTKSADYHKALLQYMGQGMQFMETLRHDLTKPFFYDMAGVILSGKLRHPEIDQPQIELAQKLYDGLGVDFLQKFKSPEERAKKALRIAGLSPKDIGNLLRGSQYMRETRKRQAKRAAKKASKPSS